MAINTNTTEVVDKAYQRAKETYFYERTWAHIRLVQEAAKKIAMLFPEFLPLIDIAQQHDANKFEEPEKEAYIDLTWEKFVNGNPSNPLWNETTLHHITNSTHHPEYWNKEEANISSENRDASAKAIDASRMPDLAIAEMVADWQAMSEELNGKVRDWYNKVKDVRWKFSPAQDALIDKLIAVFEQ